MTEKMTEKMTDTIDTIDIVGLVNNNPLTKLGSNYGSKIIQKIRYKFIDEDQQLFVANFYCFLNYNQKTDFVISLYRIWKWLGYSRINECKTVLVKNFKENIDYKIENFALEVAKAKTEPIEEREKDNRGGHNKEYITLTVNCFKKLCLKSRTSRADQIHDYYIGLEEILNETVSEQAEELQKKLLTKDRENEDMLEQTILDNFPLNELCIYYGKISNKTTKNEKLIKIGYSNELPRRVKEHKQLYNNFKLIKAFKVLNPIHIENCIKNHPILNKKRRTITINDKNCTELFAYEDLTLDKINEYITNIIKENEYNIENYTLLLEKNKKLEIETNNLKNENIKLIEENDKYKSRVSRILTSRGYTDECTNGYYIYLFRVSDIRYISNICRVDEIDKREKELQTVYKTGKIEYKIQIKYPVLEKINALVMKKIFTPFGNSVYEGIFDDMVIYLDFIKKLENIIILGLKNVNEVNDLLDPKKSTQILPENNPEIPIVRKSKRPIDQINPETKEIINTFSSIEEAGRKIGCTGSAIGIALRNKKMCKGFLFVYSGITQEEQFLDQPVIKINCNTGEKTEFKNIASAARDANISAPGLRNRINTDVHVNNYHWIWSQNAKHYE